MPLKERLRSIEATQEGTSVKRKNTKTGKIVEIYGKKTGNIRLLVKVKVDKVGTSNWIPIIDTPDMITAIHGDYESLEGKKCEIEYYGTSINNGVVTRIVGSSNANSDLVGKQAQVWHQGTAFAPPGSGLI